jgi:hypothetical protein
MQQVNSQSLTLFDVNLLIRRYKMQAKTQRMKVTDEYRVIDDARKLLTGIEGLSYPTQIELTERALYINGLFYQVLRKQSNKDNNSEFEEAREKRVERHITSSSLAIGPVLAADKGSVAYIYNSNKTMKEMNPSSGGGGKSDKPKTAEAQKGFVLGKLLQALLRIRERCLMKPDEPVFQVVQVPLLTESSLSLLHEDDYL